MAYVLVYDNPERPYIIGLTFQTCEEARERMAQCKRRGMLDSHFQIVKDDDPVAKMLRDSNHLF